jgi:acetyl esterase/lipase
VVVRLRSLLFPFPFLAGLLPAGCSGADVLNALAPIGGVAVFRDIAYDSGPRQTLDVYQPPNARNAPIAVFFYGGSWQEGRKADYAFVALALARRGIVTVVPDYRVYPDVLFDGYMRDGADAVAWAERHAAAYGADPHRLVLAGHSAGAQIATLLSLDRRWLDRVGIDPHAAVAGVVGLAGPYDFLPLHDDILKTIFGAPALIADTQPITFADGTNPPMLLLNDEGDKTINSKNTANLASRVREHGGSVEVRIYSGLNHRLMIGAVSDALGIIYPVRDDIIRFITTLKPTPNAAER